MEYRSYAAQIRAGAHVVRILKMGSVYQDSSPSREKKILDFFFAKLIPAEFRAPGWVLDVLTTSIVSAVKFYIDL